MSEQPPSGKPNYGSAIRVAQIIHWLHQFPFGISMWDLKSRLGVSERTLARYIGTLKDTFYDEEGDPLVEVVKSGAQSRLRFRRKRFDMEGTAYELMSLYLALDLMAFLDGTFLLEGAQEVLDRLQTTLHRRHGHETNLVLKDFHKKFFHWTEAPKDYSDHNDMLTSLVKALVLQRQIEMVYKKADAAQTKTHRLLPLSLLMFKRALYLVARKQDTSGSGEVRNITFAVERIQEVTVLAETFSYPHDYEPAERFQDSFGLVSKDQPQRVLLRFTPPVAANVASRRWHTSQEMTWLDGGVLEMSLKLATGEEFLSWLMGYGHYVQVLEPATLVEKISKRLEETLALYR